MDRQLLATLTIRGPLTIEPEAMLAAYQVVERMIRGSQSRMLKQSEGKGWPIKRSAILDEFAEIRRSVFSQLTGLCLTPTPNYSSGSSAN